MRRAQFVLLFAVLSVFLTGCEDVKWFETHDKAKLVALSDKELKKDTYYIKDGTKFYKVFDPEVGASTRTTNFASEDRIIPLYDNTQLLPTHYKGELIAYQTDSKFLSGITLERFRDLGYSFGVWGGTFDANGYYTFNRKKSVIEDSSIGAAIGKTSSEDIRIVAIDGVPLTQDMVDGRGGVILGLKQGQKYNVQMYAGTKFMECELIADTQMLQSFELFSYGQDLIGFSSNGYQCFSTPDDLRSGYYLIPRAGLFKYYANEKGQETALVDMNISYYGSERDKMEACSRQWTIDINNKVKDVAVQIFYSLAGTEIAEEEIKGFAYSPSGIQYDMKIDSKAHCASLSLTEAEIGEWKINIAPKAINVTDVKVDSTKIGEEATLKQEDFTFTENTTNIVFHAETKGEGDVYGYIVAPDGRTYDMTYDYDKRSSTGKIHYELAFASEGTYKVKIYYHPTTTDLTEIVMDDNTETETDVIYVD